MGELNPGISGSRDPGINSLAVTLFGEWRGERNRRCVEDNAANLVYLNKPFAAMSDDGINYCVPFFSGRDQKTESHSACVLANFLIAFARFALAGKYARMSVYAVVLFQGCRIVDIA